MDLNLDDQEVRVLGSLMEKEMATPEYYPLSLNALTNACNQKTNREPVVEYDEETVLEALESLKRKGILWQSDASRVPKYGQNFVQNFNLINKEAALLCVLFLRGPQTPGELRGRTDRLYSFPDLDSVTEALAQLEDNGFVRKLPRQVGRKESRYAHLLSGHPQENMESSIAVSGAPVPPIQAREERLAALEEDVRSLRREIVLLKEEFELFKKQFE